MKEELHSIKKYILLILIAGLVFWAINNLNLIGNILGTIFSVLFPFILGGIIAFILNIPMNKIEKGLKKVIKNKKGKVPIRMISIILALLIFIAIIAIVAFLLIPELIDSLALLMENVPELIENIQSWLIGLLEQYPDIQTQIQEIFAENEEISTTITNLLGGLAGGLVGFVSSIISGCVTVFTALIFAVYMLSQKEYLIRATKKMINAYMKPEHSKKLINIGNLANETFNKFISGQCLEACILGGMIFLACLILRIPYALMIGVLTAVTALIPIFGAIIAAVIGAILIGITNPLKAVLFIVVFLVIQQIEGNIIYPRVVGKSVGLSPMWTLLSVSVGGSLFGIVGMIIGLPVASILYAVIRNNVNMRLKDSLTELKLE